MLIVYGYAHSSILLGPSTKQPVSAFQLSWFLERRLGIAGLTKYEDIFFLGAKRAIFYLAAVSSQHTLWRVRIPTWFRRMNRHNAYINGDTAYSRGNSHLSISPLRWDSPSLILASRINSSTRGPSKYKADCCWAGSSHDRSLLSEGEGNCFYD